METRIKPNKSPSPKAQEQLNDVKKKMGSIPSLFTTLAHSPAALGFYLNGSAALNETKILPALREQISVAVAMINSCDYCASAHTAIGKMCKLDDHELSQNLIGKSNDPKTQAALKFAGQIVKLRGMISDSDLNAIRAAGYGDEEIVEIIAVVCQNIFSNYFNHIAGTEVDFPRVSTATAAAR